MSGEQGFFARWSRRKVEGQRGEPLSPEAPAVQPVAVADADAAVAVPAPPVVPQVPAAVETPPSLDDVAALAPGDEVSRFVARGVDEAVRRAAVKKLFTDPHFNIMDGLDTYIDDYGKPDPIPAAMLRQMNQSRALGLFSDEDKPQVPAGPAAATIPAQDADPAAAPAAEAVPQTDDEDPDLQLQPDDAARRPGADEGAGSGGV
ncbi:MAG TPA: DUF3306 domain-containing protein [Methylibium sp.]|nr:DUF3306 domain-containing protein [Methylibium sp.]